MHPPEETVNDMTQPSPCNWSRERIERFASEVADRGGFCAPGDVVALVRCFGGEVRYLDYDEWLSESGTGTIAVRGKHDFDILIPRFTSPTRDRFTIAHELGHYFLHSRQGEVAPVKIPRHGGGLVESEANAFAAALLMPEGKFRERAREFRDRYGDAWLPMLANNFDVSVDAARVRANILSEK